MANSKKIKKITDEMILAFKSTTDCLGSYVGITDTGEPPVQDVDDL